MLSWTSLSLYFEDILMHCTTGLLKLSMIYGGWQFSCVVEIVGLLWMRESVHGYNKGGREWCQTRCLGLQTDRKLSVVWLSLDICCKKVELLNRAKRRESSSMSGNQVSQEGDDEVKRKVWRKWTGNLHSKICKPCYEYAKPVWVLLKMLYENGLHTLDYYD